MMALGGGAFGGGKNGLLSKCKGLFKRKPKGEGAKDGKGGKDAKKDDKEKEIVANKV
jgi:hypothetical protein